MTVVAVPMLPQRLSERYEVGPVIGRGVGSSVFRAHDTLLDRDAAVKTFRMESARVPSTARADREVGLLATMDHPGLVPVYDVEQQDGRAFVVMALLDGGSLTARIDDHGECPDGLPLADALRTGGAVAGALDHLHRAGVLHRAVTPANVLYDADGRAHLSDFGVAFLAEAPRITDTGLTVGAAPYLAPEQVRGERAGPRADVYALGLVLIEALTGRRAFPGDPLSSAQARLTRDPTLPQGLPRDVARLVAAMTAADPDARPGAADALVALRRALADTEPLSLPAVLAGRASRGQRPSPLPRALGGSSTAAAPAGSAAAGDRSPRAERPRAVRRGLLVLAGLAASAVLAGTVAIAGTGSVARISADGRPAAVVPGGATVGPAGPTLTIAAAPAPASRPAGDAPVAPAPTPTEQRPVRNAAAPAGETSDASGSRPTRTTTADPDSGDQRSDRGSDDRYSGDQGSDDRHPGDDSERDDTASDDTASDESSGEGSSGDDTASQDTRGQDSDGPTDAGSSGDAHPAGPVGGALQGVESLVGGLLDGGH